MVRFPNVSFLLETLRVDVTVKILLTGHLFYKEKCWNCYTIRLFKIRVLNINTYSIHKNAYLSGEIIHSLLPPIESIRLKSLQTVPAYLCFPDFSLSH